MDTGSALPAYKHELYNKYIFNLVSRALFDSVSVQGVPSKYINIVKVLDSQTTEKAELYGRSRRCFKSSSEVCQEFPLSSFLYKIVMDDITEQALNNSAKKTWHTKV